MPTADQQQTKKGLKPRFKVDPAASPMPETKQPECLAPRATSNRNGGRDHLGILGEIKSVHPGEIIGIRKRKHSISAHKGPVNILVNEEPRYSQDAVVDRAMYRAQKRAKSNALQF
ncbi:hypothetical protein H8B02_44750 [Bradyrhizobium sp. Pear77]|uniref:hypothetical protein n=1 Tax=Bradyrhizobium altum TaxID=1571202 RepID=UPI001E58ADD1|nr:hypothetical protein [Bradyrhizobium altum]MCC8960265.1 hypothetical protein [Bradyrhizobium altum]